MQRVSLALVRFCLSAWVGIATFFVVLVIELRQSELFPEPIKFNHPKVLFPLYYGFEFGLLGTALVGAAACAWSSKGAAGRWRALFGVVLAGLLLAGCDYGFIYRPLVDMMQAAKTGETGLPLLPPKFHELHRSSRWLNEGILTLTALGALLSLGIRSHVGSDEPRAGASDAG